MHADNSEKVYRLVSGFNGWISGLIIASNHHSAIETFCRVHSLYPAQVAVLYSYPLLTT